MRCRHSDIFNIFNVRVRVRPSIQQWGEMHFHIPRRVCLSTLNVLFGWRPHFTLYYYLANSTTGRCRHTFALQSIRQLCVPFRWREWAACRRNGNDCLTHNTHIRNTIEEHANKETQLSGETEEHRKYAYCNVLNWRDSRPCQMSLHEGSRNESEWSCSLSWLRCMLGHYCVVQQLILGRFYSSSHMSLCSTIDSAGCCVVHYVYEMKCDINLLILFIFSLDIQRRGFLYFHSDDAFSISIINDHFWRWFPALEQSENSFFFCSVLDPPMIVTNVPAHFYHCVIAALSI